MKRYMITAIYTKGIERNIFTDGRTYKRKGQAQNMADQMQEVMEPILEVKEVEIDPCPHCGNHETSLSFQAK